MCVYALGMLGEVASSLLKIYVGDWYAVDE